MQESCELPSDEQTGEGSLLITGPGLNSEDSDLHESSPPRSGGSSTPTKRSAEPQNDHTVLRARKRVQALSESVVVEDPPSSVLTVDGAAVGVVDSLRAGSLSRGMVGGGPVPNAQVSTVSLEGSCGPVSVDGAATAECSTGEIAADFPRANDSVGLLAPGEIANRIDFQLYQNPKVEESEGKRYLCQYRSPEGRRCSALAEYIVPVWDPQPVPRVPPGMTQAGDYWCFAHAVCALTAAIPGPLARTRLSDWRRQYEHAFSLVKQRVDERKTAEEAVKQSHLELHEMVEHRQSVLNLAAEECQVLKNEQIAQEVESARLVEGSEARVARVEQQAEFVVNTVAQQGEEVVQQRAQLLRAEAVAFQRRTVAECTSEVESVKQAARTELAEAQEAIAAALNQRQELEARLSEEMRSHQEVVTASARRNQELSSQLMTVLDETHVAAYGVQVECEAARDEADRKGKEASEVAMDKSRLQREVWGRGKS